MKTVIITPEMRGILQTLANIVLNQRRQLADAEAQFNTYVGQCASMFGLLESTKFDPNTGSFITADE